MDTYPLFAKLIGVGRLGLSPKELKKAQTLLKKYDLKHANLSATYSSVSKKVLEDKALNFIAKAIDNQFQVYTRSFLKYINSFKMTTSWITKVHPGSKSHEHVHSNSMISGVAYIQCPPKSGNLSFHNKETGLFDLPTETMNLWNSLIYSFEPQANTVVFFPSDTYHGVDENQSTEQRYSLAFNYLPIGEAGTPGTDSSVFLR